MPKANPIISNPIHTKQNQSPTISHFTTVKPKTQTPHWLTWPTKTSSQNITKKKKCLCRCHFSTHRITQHSKPKIKLTKYILAKKSSDPLTKPSLLAKISTMKSIPVNSSKKIQDPLLKPPPVHIVPLKTTRDHRNSAPRRYHSSHFSTLPEQSRTTIGWSFDTATRGFATQRWLWAILAPPASISQLHKPPISPRHPSCSSSPFQGKRHNPHRKTHGNPIAHLTDRLRSHLADCLRSRFSGGERDLEKRE